MRVGVRFGWMALSLISSFSIPSIPSFPFSFFLPSFLPSFNLHPPLYSFLPPHPSPSSSSLFLLPPIPSLPPFSSASFLFLISPTTILSPLFFTHPSDRCAKYLNLFSHLSSSPTQHTTLTTPCIVSNLYFTKLPLIHHPHSLSVSLIIDSPPVR